MTEEFDPIRAIARSWWIVLLCALLGAGILAAVYAGQPKSYTSDATLLYNPSGITAGGGVFAVGNDDRALSTLSDVITSDVILKPIAAAAKVDVRDVRRNVTVDSTALSNVLTIHVTNRTAQGAQQLAQAVVTSTLNKSKSDGLAQMQSQSDSLDKQITDLSDQAALDRAQKQDTGVLSSQISTLRGQKATLDAQIGSYSGPLSTLNGPDLPPSPSSPGAKRGLVEGGGLGLVLGVLIALGRGTRRRGSRRASQPAYVEDLADARA